MIIQLAVIMWVLIIGIYQLIKCLKIMDINTIKIKSI